MKGCWDPEFDPSVEEMHGLSMIYGAAILSVRSLASSHYFLSMHACTLRCTGGGHVEPVRVTSTLNVQPARLKPRAPIYAYTEHAQLSEVDDGGVK